ncbi:transmembrane and TPR repeat-containing protein 1-like [Lingula anatina]|uniref:dolichyl-phosphate-mannose--protein mannosyltransferase n=1 Tax=Lingula anatina TaxID=7574 RepID=A0A1S3H6C7_LINAN|nr:transmembrane and TPR repeat-containing protein 1-like [Lingula anatina]|eukprot:XP_013381670.1 transmembrane and TPR repeat-containing protein 1-like [Lingula anatina]
MMAVKRRVGCSEGQQEENSVPLIRNINNNYLYSQQERLLNRENGKLLKYVLPSAACLLCYVNSLQGDFVHDDVSAIKSNGDVTGNTPWSQMFSNDFWGKSMADNTSHKSYRPLCVLSFRLNYMLGGLNPVSFHVVNVALHTIATLLFVHICDTLVYRPSSHLALLAGLLFAVHPVHTEAVAGIVGQADVLACIFFQLSFLCYVRCINCQSGEEFPTVKRIPIFMLSMVLGTAAMFTKEHGITVLGVNILYDTFVICHGGTLRVLRKRSLTRNCTPLVKRMIFTSCVVILLLSFRIWMLHGMLPAFSEQDNPASFAPHLLTRFLTYSYLLVFNMWLLLAPITLSYDWQMGSIPLVETLWDIRNLATLIFAIVMLFLVVFVIRKLWTSTGKVTFTGLLFLTLPFLPASNLFIRVGFVVAERILYISSMGFCILVVQGFDSITIKFKQKKRLLHAMLYCLVALFAARTVIRNRVWYNRETLFTSGLETLPHNAKVHYNYANMLKDWGRIEQAIHHYRTALRLFPNHASANNNLGTLLNDPVDAEAHYRRAIQISPGHTNAHFNLGNVLHKTGRSEEAIKVFHRAIQLDPHYTDPYTNLGGILATLGRHSEADWCYRRVIQEDPHNADAYNNYGAFLQRLGKNEDALQYYMKATSLQPNNVVVITNAGRALRTLERNDEAEDMFKRALSIKRDSINLDTLAVFYFNQGRTTEALKIFNELERSFPNDLDAMCHYAQALTRLEQYSKAEALLLRILHTDGGHVEALRQLATLCGILGRHQEALQHISKALSPGAQTVDKLTRAAIYYEEGNHWKDLKQYQQAAKSYKAAVSLDPSLPQAWLNLGAIYHLLKVEATSVALKAIFLLQYFLILRGWAIQQYLSKARSTVSNMVAFDDIVPIG